MTKPNQPKAKPKGFTSVFDLPKDADLANKIVGPDKRFISLLEENFGGEIKRREYSLRLKNESEENVKLTALALEKMTTRSKHEESLYVSDVMEIIEKVKNNKANDLTDERQLAGERPTAALTAKVIPGTGKPQEILYGLKGKVISAETENQKKLAQAVNDNPIVFAIGQAGTGKTYTGVALAVNAYKTKQVKRIIITRPAVEAGENLGFLPGDMKEKLDPYMQPIYDALRDMLPQEHLNDMQLKGTLQIAPLAFMRGRTLDDAFVILDEAQNTTRGQMKMFLTRMGKNAQFYITGDKSQNDLPFRVGSGLGYATSALANIKGIEIVQLEGKDNMRHPLVADMISAMDIFDENEEAMFAKQRAEKAAKAANENNFAKNATDLAQPLQPDATEEVIVAAAAPSPQQ